MSKFKTLTIHRTLWEQPIKIIKLELNKYIDC